MNMHLPSTISLYLTEVKCRPKVFRAKLRIISQLRLVLHPILITSPALKMRALLRLLLLALVTDVMAKRQPRSGIRNKRSLAFEGDCQYACEVDGSCKVS